MPVLTLVVVSLFSMVFPPPQAIRRVVAQIRTMANLVQKRTVVERRPADVAAVRRRRSSSVSK